MRNGKRRPALAAVTLLDPKHMNTAMPITTNAAVCGSATASNSKATLYSSACQGPPSKLRKDPELRSLADASQIHMLAGGFAMLSQYRTPDCISKGCWSETV